MVGGIVESGAEGVLDVALSALEVVAAVAAQTVTVEVHTVAQCVAHYAAALRHVIVVAAVAGRTGSITGHESAVLVGVDNAGAVLE